MTRVEKIERDITALEPQELERLRVWFAKFDAARWDAAIEADAASGKLDELADAAIAAHRAGRSRPM